MSSRNARQRISGTQTRAAVIAVALDPGSERLSGRDDRAASLGLAEHAGEDRVDVLEVVAEVEQRLELGAESVPWTRRGRPSAASRKSPLAAARPAWRCAARGDRRPRARRPSGSAPAARAASGPGRRGGRGCAACSRDRPPASRSRRPCGASAKSSVTVASGPIMRSTEEWRDVALVPERHVLHRRAAQ